MRLLVGRFFLRALLARLAADALVFVRLAALLPALGGAINPASQTLGRGRPRETKHPGQRHQQQADRQQRRTGCTQPGQRQRPQQAAQQTARVARQPSIPAVQAAPLQHRAGQQQQQHAARSRRALPAQAVAPSPQARRGRRSASSPGARGRRSRPTQPARQPRDPNPAQRQHQPPDRHTEEKITQVGQPSPALPAPVGRSGPGAGAGSGPSGIGAGIGEQGQPPEGQHTGPEQQRQLVRKTPDATGCGMRRVFIEGVDR